MFWIVPNYVISKIKLFRSSTKDYEENPTFLHIHYLSIFFIILLPPYEYYHRVPDLSKPPDLTKTDSLIEVPFRP